VPVREPLASPVVGEVQIVAGDVHSQFVVAGDEDAVFGSALSELSGNVRVHGNDSIVSDLDELVGKTLGFNVNAVFFDLCIQGQGIEREFHLLDWVVVDKLFDLLDHWLLALVLIVLILIVLVILLVLLLIIVLSAIFVILVVLIILIVIVVVILVILILLLPWLLLLLHLGSIPHYGLLSSTDINDHCPVISWQLQVILVGFVVFSESLLGLGRVQSVGADDVCYIVEDVLLFSDWGVLDAELNDFLDCSSTHIF
jgi:hypothetical protein